MEGTSSTNSACLAFRLSSELARKVVVMIIRYYVPRIPEFQNFGIFG
jgi:hypothetical protein